MSTVLERTYVHDGEIDLALVAQLSGVGSLADEVLADLIKSRAGLLATSESQSIRRATDLFKATVEAVEMPATLRASSGLSDALRRMSAIPRVPSDSASHPTGREWLKSLKAVCAALESATADRAAGPQLELLRTYFTGIAAGTMDAVLTAVHPRSYSTSWLTA